MKKGPTWKNGLILGVETYSTEWKGWYLHIAISDGTWDWTAEQIRGKKTLYSSGKIGKHYCQAGYKNAALALASFRSFAAKMNWKIPQSLWQLPKEDEVHMMGAV